MSETGKTPLHSASELETMGYAIALFPSSTVRLTVKVVGDFLSDLKRTGDSREWVDRMASLETTNRALGLEAINAFDAKIAGRS
jgi:2-methylisocitrate lyase-like PEP mutase family enzyme